MWIYEKKRWVDGFLVVGWNFDFWLLLVGVFVDHGLLLLLKLDLKFFFLVYVLDLDLLM